VADSIGFYFYIFIYFIYFISYNSTIIEPLLDSCRFTSSVFDPIFKTLVKNETYNTGSPMAMPFICADVRAKPSVFEEPFPCSHVE
jgi:hypothetical protein